MLSSKKRGISGDVNDADQFMHVYRQSFVYACDVNGSIINRPPFMTQKSLQSYLYPAHRITNLVSVRSYKGANKHRTKSNRRIRPVDSVANSAVSPRNWACFRLIPRGKIEVAVLRLTFFRTLKRSD